MVTCSNILVVTILILVSNFNTGIWLVNGCSGRDFRCGPDGPPIRFPFRLKDKETEQSCGYNGFDLTCSDTNKTQIELPSHSGPIILEVMKIIYPHNLLYLTDPENCLPRQFLKLLRSPISPFPFYESPGVRYKYNLTILHCSSSLCPVIVVDSSDTLLNSVLDPIDCTKTSDFTSSALYWGVNNNLLVLTWSKPNCSKCEKEGKMCKLKNNGTEDGEIECFDRHHKPTKKILLYVTVGFVGLVLVTLILTACLHFYTYFKLKGEDETRIEKFLEDYRTLNPARFSYTDIKRITNSFREKLGEGAHGAVFKGKLSNEILVAVKMLNNAEGDGKEFINEVKAMGKVHHINVVRLVGFCADGCYRALVYNFFPNGSLQNFITKPDDIDRFLGWEKLQQIALGIAKGIEYLHMSCDQRILHFDINPHNVLLDDKFVPKITDFGLAKLCPKNQSVVSVTAARGTLGYIAPEVFSRNFGNVSYKADIYSYGMLLLEMIGGRKNIGQLSEENFQILYPEWIHNLLEGQDMQMTIEGEEDDKILKKLAIVGLWCIQWHPINRPSIKVVLQMLEALEEEKLIVPPNPFNSTISRVVETQTKFSTLELEAIHE
ncbi:rust resistance kinase Lr10-like [Trifolium pratense]|uniref:rust resistance kinase Lr10-like n=1 Tax=Trifolium pratense TaxID=57577 RepID=UPI001E6908FC|nr:rust resistance kinase Lr10-like [Trifolium pratense]XP_045815180.1 rust resistance kinase Lr10-like [Trifolium pratense]